MPVLLEKGEVGGAQVPICWNSCGGLGGNARFTIVLRSPRQVTCRVPWGLRIASAAPRVRPFLLSSLGEIFSTGAAVRVE